MFRFIHNINYLNYYEVFKFDFILYCVLMFKSVHNRNYSNY